MMEVGAQMEDRVKGDYSAEGTPTAFLPLGHPALSCVPASPAHLPPLVPFALTGCCLSYTWDRPSWPGKWPLGGGGSELTCPSLPTLSRWDGAPAFSPAQRRGPPAPAEKGRCVCLVPELGFTACWAHRRLHPLKP